MAGRGWVDGWATLSPDGVYRYELWRTLDVPLLGSKGTVAFCMLNPSTADSVRDDPTIRRCLGYARSWGYHKLAVVNLYPYRATSPKALHAWLATEGKPGTNVGLARVANDHHIGDVARVADLMVAAWGNCGHGSPQAEEVLHMYTWHALALSKQGAPVHPLYQPATVQPRLLQPTTTWGLV